MDEAISDPARVSPVALLAPNGLEALAHFDMYSDIARICVSLQRATNAAFSGDFWTSSVTETKVKTQLRDLLALGTSNNAWGRRCEIMKCVCLSGLIYLRVISRKDIGTLVAHQRLSELLPRSDSLWKQQLGILIEELLAADAGDCFASLAVLMRIGTLLNQESWYDIRRQLQDIYLEVHKVPLPLSVKGQNSQETEMAGLTALFGFFDIVGS